MENAKIVNYREKDEKIIKLKGMEKFEDPFNVHFKIEKIEVEDGNEFYKTIEDVLFSKNGDVLICYPNNKKDESYTIPKGVKVIDKWAFGVNYNIKSVVLPESVKTICEYAFFDCKSLEEIAIPSSVKIIKEVTFAICRKLGKIYIPKSVTKIGESAFSQCDSLKDVYYQGTEEEWSKVEIDSDDNDCLINAKIHFNSKQ